MSIGDTVLDGYKQTASWYDNGVEWLSDVMDFYRERAAIEKEAAGKLATLTAKHFSKKANASAGMSVGNKPLTTPGSLENMTMQSWMETLNQTERCSEERKKLADEINTKVVDEIAVVKSHFEDLSRKYKHFIEIVEERQEKIASHVKRAKSQYDSACESMESARAKSKKSIESREDEMYKAKNSYIVQINVANRMKDKYYHDDLPEILDSMQRSQEARVAQTNRLLITANKLENLSLSNMSKSIEQILESIYRNEPARDSEMFIEHNANAFIWSDPADWLFEPSPIWHDNESMYVKSESSIRFLNALLNEASSNNVAATTTSQNALTIYDNAKQAVIEAKFVDMLPKQAASLLSTEISALKKLVEAESKRLELVVEIEAIEAATASVDMSHVPQTRLKTHRTIFGKKKEVVEVVKGKAGDSGSSHGSLGLTSLLARSSLGQSLGVKNKASVNAMQASVLYDFTGASQVELNVRAGQILDVLNEDDGSGWVKLSGPNGSGLVPASYVNILTKRSPPTPSPRKLPKEQKMIAIYDYEAQDSAQLTIHVNDSITITEKDPGSGWTTGVLHGKQGIFPTSYARPA